MTKIDFFKIIYIFYLHIQPSLRVMETTEALQVMHPEMREALQALGVFPSREDEPQEGPISRSSTGYEGEDEDYEGDESEDDELD